jgi:hypothetical protein
MTDDLAEALARIDQVAKGDREIAALREALRLALAEIERLSHG